MFKMSEQFTKTAKLKKEWSEIEAKGVEAILQEYFKENHRIKNIGDYFGLAYTSSSDFAALWNTNKNFEIEIGIKLIGFVITENNILLALGEDQEENNYLYRLEA